MTQLTAVLGEIPKTAASGAWHDQLCTATMMTPSVNLHITSTVIHTAAMSVILTSTQFPGLVIVQLAVLTPGLRVHSALGNTNGTPAGAPLHKPVHAAPIELLGHKGGHLPAETGALGTMGQRTAATAATAYAQQKLFRSAR